MARTDAKTVSAAALIGLAALTAVRNPSSSDQTAAPSPQIHRVTGSGTRAETKEEIRAAASAKIESMLHFHGHKVHIIVATVADPDRTTLRLNTDRTIDALLLAAFQENYVLVDQWIPWKFSLEQMDQDYSDRKREKLEIEEQSRYPGVLVLENNEQILSYLLVPESPTGGVNREVLENTVDFIKRLDSDRKAPLVGPSFTAGLESVDEWIEESSDARRVVSRIITGNITGINEARGRRAFGGIAFHVVRQQRTNADMMVSQFLAKNRPHRNRIVNLVEDSTRFGKALNSANTDIETLTFPWQISRVRNAMPDLMVKETRSNGDFALQLQIKELRRPEGALPTFAGAQTPAVQEVVLTQIASRLERTRTDYVNIVATDVLDALFLSRMLRTANPSQRILTSQPDLAYVRTQDSAQTTGLLATASFPISNHLRYREAPDNAPAREPRQIMFDSELSAATFTAALEAIRHQDGRGSSNDGLMLKMDGLSARPLWLLGLGRNGYWPVARLDDGPPVALVPDTFSISWLALYCASLAGCVVWLAAAVAARYRWVGGLVDIRVERQWPQWHIEARSLTILTAIAGTAFATASMPIWWSAFRQEDVATGWILVFWVGLLALTLAGIVPWVHWDSHSFSKQAVLGLIAALPAIAVVGLNALGPKQDSFLLLHFFLLRSQDYLSGIAPILPFLLLLLGFVGCAWSWHLGTVLSQERYVRLGALGSPTFCRTHFHYAALAICLIAVVPVALVSVHALHSLEPVEFDRAYITLLCLLLIATYYACFRFVAMWQQVKSLLGRLELHPMRAALEAMPKEKDGAPIWESHPRRRSSWFYQRALENLQDIKKNYPETKDLDEAITELRSFLKLSLRGQDASRIQVEALLSNVGERFEKDLEREDGPWSITRSTPTPLDQLKQQFIVHRFSAFLRACFLHLRNRMTAMTAGFVAITLSLNSYAFGPERMIQSFTISVILLIGVFVVSVFFQMHRNPMLVMLSGAESGKLDWGLWAKIASAAAIPVLTLLASYTPTLGQFLGKWLQPTLEAVTK